MTKITAYDLLKSTKTVATFGELAALIELKKQGFNAEWHGSRKYFDILAGGKKIEVKSCNYDNSWARNKNLIGGWDRINPEKFDYLVCVSFNKDFDDVRYFIFDRKETREFPKVAWKNSKGLKNLEFVREDERTDRLIKISENRWDKVK